MISLQAALAVMVLSGSPSQTVMLDFHADWCGPCHAMDSTVRDLSSMGYPVRRVNVDHEPALAAQFHVQTIPCFVMLVDGREVDRVVGGTSFSRLQKMCKAAIARPAAADQAAPVLLARAQAPAAPALSAPALSPPTAAAIPVSWAPQPSGPAVSDAALLAASVRLRVEDPDGRSCGSGTIIDARQGEALILTCGHIFRDSKGKGRIEVDLFGPLAGQRVAGRLISFDLTRDVGLVSIRTPGQLSAARVAPPTFRAATGEPVVTVGCNNGDDPTPRHSRVLSIDKFMGPPNLTVEGEPVEGRSGGGVFSRNGMLVGICNAADRNDHAGYCAALPTIYAEMDRAGVAFLYKEEPKAAATPIALVSAETPAASPSWSLPAAAPLSLPAPPANLAAAAGAVEAGEAAKLAPGEQAAWDEIHRHLQEGDKVVCVIQNVRDPQAKSEVIMLGNEAGAGETRHETSLEVHPERPAPRELSPPRERKPILEWDAASGYRHQEPLPAAQ
jgi:thiol-disulfide isomerase/thioredoxin